MKNCDYCGRVNDESAAACVECGAASKVEIPQGEVSSASGDGSIPKGAKWILYFGAWGAVIFGTWSRNPEELWAAPAFPVGLLAVLAEKDAIIAAWIGGLGAMFVGWVMYIWLAVAIQRARRASVFLPIYVVFCLLLALNVGGCRKLIDAAAGIH